MRTYTKDEAVRACIYTRVSTEKQDMEGYSIEEQERLCRATVESKEMEYVKTYSDPGVSGKTMDRPGLQAMIKAIEDGEIDAVVILKLDRLSRSQKDTLTIIEDILIANNITLISVKETLDTSTPWGRAMIGILASFNQLDRENIVQRTTMGRNAKAAQGGYAGGRPPYGYEAKGDKLVVNPTEADAVRIIFKLHQDGRSQRKIAEALAQLGCTTRKGKNIAYSTVAQILENEDFYKGNWKYGDVYIKDHHEAIL